MRVPLTARRENQSILKEINPEYSLEELMTSLVAQTVKNPPAMWEDLGSIPGLGKCPGGGHGNPLQCSCVENPHGQRSLSGFSPWGHKELGMTEQLSTQET